MKFLTINGKIQTLGGKPITVPDSYDNDLIKIGGMIVKTGSGLIGSKYSAGSGGESTVTAGATFLKDGITTFLTWNELKDSANGITYGYRANLITDETIMGSFEGGMEDKAFARCSNIINIILPSTITQIQGGAFSECQNLSNFKFEGTSEQWKNIDKQLAWSSLSNFHTVECQDKTINLGKLSSPTLDPDTVDFDYFKAAGGISFIENNSIIGVFGDSGDAAVFGESSIEIIHVPDFIEILGPKSFKNFTVLSELWLPNSLQSIESEALYGCTALTDITFDGTKAEWNAIEKASGWDEASSISIIHCTDGDVNFDGVSITENCITFSSSDEFTISANNGQWDGKLEYSLDKTSWIEWNGSELSACLNNNEYALYFRGIGNSFIRTGNIEEGESDTIYTGPCFDISGSNVECIGNIENLLDYIVRHPTMGTRTFVGLFINCNALIKAPDLPATNLADECYSHMFSNCTNLTQAPALPATTLADSCYSSMFRGCTSLTQAPALPATTLASYCYGYMFSDCTSLTKAPALPATTLADSCYRDMFRGCTSLTQAPALPATTLASYCYQSMFSGCTSLTQVPALPATTLANDCYRYMFSDCTSLTKAPALPATTLAYRCYKDMFSGCTSLTQVPALPATTLANSCYANMFYGCTKIRNSSTQTGEYTQAYRIPMHLDGITASASLDRMFAYTGGTFRGTPTINTTYYLHSSNDIIEIVEVE